MGNLSMPFSVFFWEGPIKGSTPEKRSPQPLQTFDPSFTCMNYLKTANQISIDDFQQFMNMHKSQKSLKKFGYLKKFPFHYHRIHFHFFGKSGHFQDLYHQASNSKILHTIIGRKMCVCVICGLCSSNIIRLIFLRLEYIPGVPQKMH